MNCNIQNLLITGKIGNKDIAREDLKSFMSSIKDFEWTDNNIYKSAKVVEVKPTFVPTQSYTGTTGTTSTESSYEPKNINFDVFYVEESGQLENFKQYKLDLENRRVQMQDRILQKTKEFNDNFFPGESLSDLSNKKDILEAIKNNKVKIIMNSNLNSKLGRYLGHLNNQQSTQQNTQQSTQSMQNQNYNYDFTNLNMTNRK